MKKRKLNQIYVKCLIKTPIIFYGILIVGIFLFIYSTMNIQLDVVQSYAATVQEDKIYINTLHNINITMVYAYENRDEKVYPVSIAHTDSNDNGIVLTVCNNSKADLEKLPDAIHLDVVTDTQSLFKRIFMKAGSS